MSLVTSSPGPHFDPSMGASAPDEGHSPDAAETLTVDVHAEGNRVVVTAEGELDLATAPMLSEAVRNVLDGARHIVIDLDRVTFMDSTGLSVLVSTRRKITSQGGSLALVCHDARCLRVLELTGLSRVFTFYASVAAATAAGSPD